MNLLDAVIEELLEIEPFWRNCPHPGCAGICCKGADVTVDPMEWGMIREYISHLSEAEKAIIRSNASLGKNCYFRADNKCLIHAVRPENCRYTPYQCSIAGDGKLHYCMVRVGKKRCYFKTVVKDIDDFPLASVQRSCGKFLLLDNFGRKTHYIYLNWLVERSPVFPGCTHISEHTQELSRIY